jgi:molecular chaperone GrpE
VADVDKAKERSNGHGPEPSQTPEVGQLQLEVLRLQEELSRFKDQATRADEYLELARRQKADFLNYQDRVLRERKEWKREALEGFIQDFLPALDSFTWARFEEPTLMNSLRLVEREFLRILAKHGIAPIETRGRMFDPSLHEAVATEETDAKPDGSILEEVRRGWLLDGHVLRPAGVRVARRPSP